MDKTTEDDVINDAAERLVEIAGLGLYAAGVAIRAGLDKDKAMGIFAVQYDQAAEMVKQARQKLRDHAQATQPQPSAPAP